MECKERNKDQNIISEITKKLASIKTFKKYNINYKYLINIFVHIYFIGIMTI